MPKIEELKNLPRTIARRSEYLRGRGYEVTLETKYLKVRKVRAGSPEEAMQFALAREAEFAPKYFRNQNHKTFSIESIDAISVKEVQTSDDEAVTDDD